LKNRGEIVVLAVLALGVLGALFLFIGIQVARANEVADLSDQLSEARDIEIALQKASRDEKAFGLPADIGATGAKEYIDRLVPKYISREQADFFLKNFLIANVSKEDAYDTILFRSRPRNSLFQSAFAIWWLGGGGTILPIEQSADPGKESSRTPRYLPD
jgi:hypothetical protein